MRFAKVYGHYTAEQIKLAQDKLSKVFIELAASPTNKQLASGLGGDPLIFALMQPIEHIASAAIPTAATDGKRYIWNIDFILTASYLKLFFTCFHEAMHAQFMHPTRRGHRDVRLWNIVIDYIVMGMLLEWLQHRLGSKEKAVAKFKEGFGNFITVAQLKAKYVSPSKSIPGMEYWTPEPFDLEAEKRNFKIEDELDEEDVEWLKDISKRFVYVYADPDLTKERKQPYVLYDELLKAIPKCPDCGNVGVVPKGKGQSSGKGKSSDGDGKGSSDEGEGKGHGRKPGKGCGTCQGGDDLLSGGTFDEHLDCETDPVEIAKRLQDAVDMARRLNAGYIPAGILSEIGELSAPRMRWQDELRMTKQRIIAGNQKNDYTRFRTRPMFVGLLVPKRRAYACSFAVLLDTSASMTKDDMAFGISQLQSLDDKGTGTITCCDAKTYWEETTKLRNCKPDTLRSITVRGGGGTVLSSFINNYEEKLGKQDFLVIISDGALFPDDVEKMKAPTVPVFWLITSPQKFDAPFGKAFRLRD